MKLILIKCILGFKNKKMNKSKITIMMMKVKVKKIKNFI